MNNRLKTIIGLEIHVQLNTKSKMFCGCDNDAEDKEPNTVVCPVCMGYPGTLPVANIEAVKKTIKTGLALNCSIPNESKFDRKHYFYPDLPKNFQISQYNQPFAKNGNLTITHLPTYSLTKIRINRVHLEEDAGKLIHPKGAGYTLVDMNRCGTPLMEIVTEPVIDSPESAKIFLKELRLIVRYLGVSDADMEKGHLRCDANISVRRTKQSSHSDPAAGGGRISRDPSTASQDDNIKTTPIIEIKNMNSFRAVEKALSFEEKRLKEDFDELKKCVGKQTRSWDDEKGETRAMRRKEEASDYRYFPEPDVPPILMQKSKVKSQNDNSKFKIDLDKIKREIPELPEEKRERYKKLGLAEKSAETIIAKKSYADYFDQAVKAGGEPHKIYDLMINERCSTIIKIKDLVEAAKLIKDGDISNKILKEILPEMKKGKNPKDIIAKKGIKQLSDEKELQLIISQVIKNNSQAVESYKKGKSEALGFLVGQVMKETKGQANPVLTNKIIKNLLK